MTAAPLQAPVLAIDFGTSNSYFCRTAAQPPAPVGLDLGGTGRDGLATAICYRRDREPLVGDEAFEEYGDATPAERGAYRLCTRFKPDVGTEPAARDAARDFFEAVLKQSRRLRKDLAPLTHQVLVGVPCAADPTYRATLSQVFRDAGFGEIRQVEEPKGALLYQLHHRRLSAHEAMQGVLAIDFGGGTCDFAYLRRGRVNHAWGAARLGGRLFDDLFYRWFLDQHPEAARRLAEDRADFWFHARICREAKEHFSRTMARDRTEHVRHDAGRYGRFAGLTWAGFLERAAAYHPTDRLESCGHPTEAEAPRNPDGSLDLLGWFRTSLLDGLRQGGLLPGDVRHVVLCGGSSQWCFVADTVREALDVPEPRIVGSDRPVATIAEGLALLPGLERLFATSLQTLTEDLPEFERECLAPRVQEVLEQTAAGVATAVTGSFFDLDVAPRLRRFREEGGTTQALRADLDTAAQAFAGAFQQILTNHFEQAVAALPATVHRELEVWFGRHNLAAPGPPSERLDPPHQTILPGLALPAFYQEIAHLAGVLAGMLAVVLIQTPLGWLLGGLLVLTGREIGRQHASDWMADRPVPRWLRQRQLGEKRLARLRETCMRQTHRTVLDGTEALRDQLLQSVRTQVEDELQALNEFCELAPWR